MAPQTTTVHAPQLIGGPDDWINVTDKKLNFEKGKPYLIDFWYYTCVNCLRTIPYLREWNRRYREHGLTIVGIHTPEFEFAKDRANVAEAVQRLGIDYPVLLDNRYENWEAFANQYWPRKYLVDANGIIRYDHIGEGGYGDTERMIQQLILEIDPAATFPPILEPLSKSEMAGAVCYQMTPELYAGYHRGRIGNAGEGAEDHVFEYKDPKRYEKDMIYLQGLWQWRSQSILHARNTLRMEDYVLLSYRGIEVNAVIRPERREAFRVYVYQNNQPLKPEDKGIDIFFDENQQAYLLIDQPRMYRIVDNQNYGSHELKLVCSSDAFALYAFTFGACQVPDDK